RSTLRQTPWPCTATRRSSVRWRCPEGAGCRRPRPDTPGPGWRPPARTGDASFARRQKTHESFELIGAELIAERLRHDPGEFLEALRDLGVGEQDRLPDPGGR